MSARDDEFLNRKLQELKSNLQGGRPSPFPGSARSIVPDEKQTRYSASRTMMTANTLRGTQLGTQEVISIEEYKSRNPELNFQRSTMLSSHSAAPAKPAASATVFEQIYRRIDGPAPQARPLEPSIFSRGPEAPHAHPAPQGYQQASFIQSQNGSFGLNESRIPVLDKTEKHEANLISDLGHKLSAEAEGNLRLAAEVGQLMRELEGERAKTAEFDEQLHSELRDTKERENEGLGELAELERRLAEAGMRLREEDERAGMLRGELDVQRRENETMRSEIKRLGDLTGNKIIELENNMNNALRMKEFEVENYQMEKANLTNTCEFVVEQMRLRFGERTSKLEDQIRATVAEKDKLLGEGKSLLDQLKGFNAAADLRIDSVMALVRDEQNAKNEAEMGEVVNRIRAEEEELSSQQRRTQELLSRLQTSEREGKSKIVGRKNESLRLKEELASLEQQFNRFLVTFNSEEKEAEKKVSAVARLEFESRDARDKTELLDRKYNEELASIRQGHGEDLRELDAQLAASVAEEQQIQEEIRGINLRVLEFQKRHNELIGQLQNNLNATLNSALPNDPGMGMGMGIGMGRGQPQVKAGGSSGVRLDQFDDYRY